jgi:hypothetical protein
MGKKVVYHRLVALSALAEQLENALMLAIPAGKTVMGRLAANVIQEQAMLALVVPAFF